MTEPTPQDETAQAEAALQVVTHIEVLLHHPVPTFDHLIEVSDILDKLLLINHDERVKSHLGRYALVIAQRAMQIHARELGQSSMTPVLRFMRASLAGSGPTPPPQDPPG